MKLALVHSSWRDLALPILWKSVELKGTKALKKFAKGFTAVQLSGPAFTTHTFGFDGEVAPHKTSKGLLGRTLLAFNGLRELTLRGVSIDIEIFSNSSLECEPEHQR